MRGGPFAGERLDTKVWANGESKTGWAPRCLLHATDQSRREEPGCRTDNAAIGIEVGRRHAQASASQVRRVGACRPSVQSRERERAVGWAIGKWLRGGLIGRGPAPPGGG